MSDSHLLRTWTEAQINYLSDLWASGKTQKDCAGILGISVSALSGALSRFGLRPRSETSERYPTKGTTSIPEELQPRILQAILQGASQRYLEEVFGVSRSTIDRFAKSQGLRTCGKGGHKRNTKEGPSKCPSRVLQSSSGEAYTFSSGEAYTFSRPLSSCQWFLSSGRPWIVCNKKSVDSSPYCLEHTKIAYGHGASEEAL